MDCVVDLQGEVVAYGRENVFHVGENYCHDFGERGVVDVLDYGLYSEGHRARSYDSIWTVPLRRHRTINVAPSYDGCRLHLLALPGRAEQPTSGAGDVQDICGDVCVLCGEYGLGEREIFYGVR